jgi:hypothetical protein
VQPCVQLPSSSSVQDDHAAARASIPYRICIAGWIVNVRSPAANCILRESSDLLRPSALEIWAKLYASSDSSARSPPLPLPRTIVALRHVSMTTAMETRPVFLFLFTPIHWKSRHRRLDQNRIQGTVSNDISPISLRDPIAMKNMKNH